MATKKHGGWTRNFSTAFNNCRVHRRNSFQFGWQLKLWNPFDSNVLSNSCVAGVLDRCFCSTSTLPAELWRITYAHLSITLSAMYRFASFRTFRNSEAGTDGGGLFRVLDFHLMKGLDNACKSFGLEILKSAAFLFFFFLARDGGKTVTHLRYLVRHTHYWLAQE